MGTRLAIPESRLPEIEAALSKEKDAKVVRWLLGIRLIALNHRPPDIALQLNVSDRMVRNWVHRFLDGGIEAMQRQASDGRPPLLARDEEMRFKERIRNGPTDTDAFATWRGPFVRDMLGREFGVSYGRSSVYVLLHRMGFSSLMPRARHPDSSKEEQERFQKKHSPRHSGMSGSKNRTGKSSSGSRTRRVSVNKAR